MFVKKYDMEFIKGYTPVSYKALQKDLNKKFSESNKSLIELAADVKVNTTTTMYAALNQDKQSVSDKVLTNVFQSLSFDAFIMWVNGEKYYFIKSKN